MKNFRQFRKYSSNFSEISKEWISNEKKTKFITLNNEKVVITNQMIETYQNLNKKLEIEPNLDKFSGLYLTGPKNTGKTTTLKAIIEIASKINENWIIYHMVRFFEFKF
jgi:predicted AAA+ superfamily ATPase